MDSYLLDTNHLSEALRPVSRVRDRIGQLRHTGVRVGTFVPIICELEAAFPAGERGEGYRRALQRLLGRVRVWPLDRQVARLYGEIYQDVRGRGRVLSQVDIMSAAWAKYMNLAIATTDRDFEALPEIRTENWLPATGF